MYSLFTEAPSYRRRNIPLTKKAPGGEPPGALKDIPEARNQGTATQMGQSASYSGHSMLSLRLCLPMSFCSSSRFGSEKFVRKR